MSEAQEILKHSEFLEIVDTLKKKKTTAKQNLEILEIIEEKTMKK
jgi:hypothetical protein